MGKGKRLRTARQAQQQAPAVATSAGRQGTRRTLADPEHQLFAGIPAGAPGFPDFVIPGSRHNGIPKQSLKLATAAPSSKLVEGSTSETVGRIAEVSGTAAQRYLGRAAHYLWWIEDLDSQTDVALRLVMSGPKPDVLWGLRWGPPWNAGIVARAFLEASNLLLPTGTKNSSVGEVLEWLLYAGVSREELHLAMGRLGIDDPAWFLLWAALIERRPVSAHLSTVVGSDGIRAGGSAEADKLAKARRALVVAGLTATSDAKDIEPEDDEAKSPTLSEAGEWILDAWKDFGELREDGLQRIDEARDSSAGETGLARDALGILHSACLVGEQALESHRTSTERPSFAISTGAGMLSDCYRDAARTAGWLGDLDEAIRLAERAATLGKSSLDVELRAKSRQTLGHLLARRGRGTDAGRAVDCYLEAETYYRACGADDKKILRSVTMKSMAFESRKDPSILRKVPAIDLPGTRRGRSRPRHTAHEPLRRPLGDD